MQHEQMQFEKALRKVSYICKKTGIQINYEKNISKNKLTLADHLRKRWYYAGNLIFLVFAGLCVLGKMSDESIQMILYMIPCVTFAIMGQIKSLFFLYYEDKVQDIIEILRALTRSENSEENEAVKAKFLKKCVSFSNATINLLLYMCYTSMSLFCVGPLLTTGWQYWSTKKIQLFLPYSVWYPFDEYSYAGWPFAYLQQFWAARTGVFFVLGPDSFFYTACTFVHFQFFSLQIDFRKIEANCFKDKESLKTHVGGLIHRHNELIRCVDILNEIYGKSTLFHVVSSSFTICFAGFNIMANKNIVLIIPYIAFIVIAFIQIYLLCYYGDLIMDVSLDVSDAIYDCGWYELNASSMKIYLFILMRTQHPCKITAMNFGNIHLRTFSKILSSAWSYFTLINTMYTEIH